MSKQEFFLKTLLKVISIFAVQIIIGWLITTFYLKNDWNIVKFIMDPAMIAFWVAYIGIEVLIRTILHNKKKCS